MGHIDIIIPVYNEAENLHQLVKRIHTSLSAVHIRYRLIFVDDHSQDNTLNLLRQLAPQYNLIIHEKVGKKGKAFSLLEGAALATSEYVAMIDGDLQYPPEAIPQMYQMAVADRHFVVVADRKLTEISFLRRFISGSQRAIFSRFLLGLSCDVQSGLKVFRRDLLFHFHHYKLDAWSFDMPLLNTAAALGGTIGSLPITFAPRNAGHSKVNLFTTSWQIGYQAVKLKFSAPPIYSIPSTVPSNSIGAGFIHRHNPFVTHTHLPHDQSAVLTLIGWQKYSLYLLGILLLTSLALFPHHALIGLIGILSLLYFVDTFFNLFLVLKSLRHPPELSFTSTQLEALPDSQLPIYSILCPLYRESQVLPDFVKAISALQWPKSKLEVLLLLEENDQETITCAKNLNLPDYFRLVIVPHSLPKTKPKACNYGLAHAKGEYVVIYDAEDKPDPLQLKKAYLGFQKSKEDVVCLQAKLNYFNPHHNLLTRLFTIEYSLWFDITLPGLQSINTTIPLGGTSNHFKTAILRQLHGWDAFNVTEDCDLGARLFKSGYRTSIIDSVTLEEANSNLANWFRQRSRWIKGYIQTYLVHNRHPKAFIRRSGIHALIFQLIVGGKIAFMLINPILWLTTISYFAFYASVGPLIESLYPSLIFYMAGFSLVVGNFLFMYYYMLGAAKRGHWELVKFAYLIPIYWLMVSLASIKAWYQLIVNPHYWEKTHHGLHLGPARKWKWKLSMPRLPSVSFPRPAYYSGGLLIFSAALINLLNLVFNLFLGRRISLEQLGVMGLLGNFVYFTQIPLSSLSQSIAHRSAYLLGKFHSPAFYFWSRVRHRVSIIGLCVLLVWLVAMPSLSHLFRLNNILPLFMFSPILLLGTLNAVDRGFLNGNLKFIALSVMGISEAVSRLGLAYVYIYFGHPEWLYSVFPLSVLIAVLIGWATTSRLLIKSPSVQSRTSSFPSRFFLTSLLAGVSSVIFLTLDGIIAKVFLTPSQAGIYILLSLSGKMVFFAGSLFSQFILPLVSYQEGHGQSSRKSFYYLLLASFAANLAGFIGIGVFGHLTLPLLFGSRAAQLVPYLPWYSIAMLFLSLASSLVTYHQAKKEYFPAFVSLFFALFLPIGMLLYHQDIASLVAVVVAVSTGQLVSVIYFHLFSSPHLYPATNPIRDLFEVLSPHSPSISVNHATRILIINWRDTKHVWAGGAEVYIHELAKRWSASGHEVTVFCGSDGHQPRNEEIDGVKIIRRGGTYLVYIWAFLYYIFRFRDQFDVVIDCENGIPFFTPLYITLPKILLVHHVHQKVFRQQLRFPLAQIGVLLETKVMPLVYRGIKVVTVSDSSKQDILSLGFAKSEDITIINPGIDSTDKFNTYLKTSYPSFVYLGRIRPYKNIDIAIQAFSELSKEYPLAKLYIAGHGESLTQLKQLVASLNLQKNVLFLGRISDQSKIKLLSRSWAMVQPSSFEGWGITVIEANACGTPVIASNVIGLRDSVIHGRTGILVPEKNAIAFKEAMQSILLLPSYRQRLSQSALAWSRTFDWQMSSDNFFSVIQNLLAQYSGKYQYYSRPATLSAPS